MATAKWFGNAFAKAFNKEIDFDSDAVKVMLCGAGYAPNQDTHIYKSSVTSEVVGTGYTAGGIALTSRTVTYNASTNTVAFDAADVSWLASTITARYAVIYDGTTGSDATSPLIGYVDFGTDQSTAGTTFGIAWDANGILTVTPA